MSASISRAARRQYQLVSRRYASSASEAASAAKEKTSETASKASEGLSRVTSSAGSVIGKAGGALGSVVGGIGGRTGRLIGFVNSLIPPTIYYSKVGLELAKMVARDQKMSLPSADVFQKAYQSAYQTLRSSSSGSPNILQRIRGMSRAEMVGVGIVGAEVLGFFSIGEMIGRFKVVGYRGGKSHDEEH